MVFLLKSYVSDAVLPVGHRASVDRLYYMHTKRLSFSIKQALAFVFLALVVHYSENIYNLLKMHFLN